MANVWFLVVKPVLTVPANTFCKALERLSRHGRRLLCRTVPKEEWSRFRNVPLAVTYSDIDLRLQNGYISTGVRSDEGGSV